MFLVKFDKILTTNANRYDLAKAAMNGSVRFSLFSNSIVISLKG